VKALARLAAAAALSLAAAAHAATAGWPLQDAGTDVGNLASLQRGARNFVNYCLGCHSLKYMRFSQIAEDLALTEDQLRENLMFTGTRIYDPMLSAMSSQQGRLWFGNAPPDLSLITRSRGPDYVFTFLRSFYEDPMRPTGANNAVLPGTAMPHVLAPLQGLQRPRFETVAGEDGKEVQHLAGLEPGSLPGDLPEAAFDSFVRDTVAFLEYVAEPHRARREALGVWVILFLLMFTAFAWFLYKEYWKDVK
jgi:ubiquinol-cytochrome c reductase cytochrome c1 subunit